MRKYLIGIILMISTSFLVGCTSQETQDTIDGGFALLKESRYEEALAQFDLIDLDDVSNGRDFVRGKGIAYLGMKNYEEAITCFLEALSYSNGLLQSIDYDVNYYLAEAYEKNGQSDLAVEVYNAILALDSEEANAYYLRGVIRLKQGLLDEASADFEQAITNEKDNVDMVISVARSFEEAGEVERGHQYLETCLTEQGDKMVDGKKGKVYYYLGDYENAKLYLEKAKGSDEEVTIMLGGIYSELGDTDYAVSVYTEYLEANQDSVTIWTELVSCQLEEKLYEEALNTIAQIKGLEEIQMPQAVQYYEVIAYEYLLDFDTARTLMEAYLAVYPDDQDAAREYDFLVTR